MSYKKALEAAGAEVLCFEQFGSYQGDWWAKVTYQNQTGWIHGWYGSCSECDAFEAEFGYISHEHQDDDYYNPFWNDQGFIEDCDECQKLKQRFVEFGENYLDNILTQEEAEQKASENLEWDYDAKEMVDFIVANK